MSDALGITDFLDPIHLNRLSHDRGYAQGTIGNIVSVFEEELPDLSEIEIVLIGCGEERGSGKDAVTAAPDVIRHQLYSLYAWHKDVRIADVGNIRRGAGLQDTYAALRTVVGALTDIGKTVIVLGGSHDLTLAQYEAYRAAKRIIEVAIADALIDLDIAEPLKDHNFLMEMLVGEPNFIRQYNHIGFQSYLVHPHLLETMDKLRFDCYRLGAVRESMEEMEPVLRNCDLFSFDVSALQYAAAPSNYLSPNGFTGEEACALTRYAGMSPRLSSLGIYGYCFEQDIQQITAKQIAQMIWYFFDGRSKGKKEAVLSERDAFFEFNTAFAEVDTVFLQSKKTGRWWMQLPDKSYIACSYHDYIQASSNEIPERWLRAQERN